MDQKPPLNDSFSRAMSYYKSLKGVNNKDISEALNVPPTTVSAWNTGRHLPDLPRFKSLTEYLDAPVDQFFDFSLDRLPNQELSYIQEVLADNKDLVQFLKVFLQLSDEDKHLLSILATKLSK